MTDEQSIRIGSIIEVPCPGRAKTPDRAEVIGFVLGRNQKIRVMYLSDGVTELRSDLTQDNTELITY